MAIDKLKKKKGTVYRARILVGGNKRISKCFVRKVDAEKWEAEKRLDSQQPITASLRKYRLSDFNKIFLERHAANGLALATYQKYESAIRLYIDPALGSKWIEDVSKVDVWNFHAYVQTLRRSDSIRNHVFTTLKTVLRKAVAWDFTGRNPSEGVSAPRKGLPRTEYWSKDEINHFLEVMKEHHRFGLYMIALNTGMRLGEIFGLKWDCVDFDHRIISVRRTFDQKNDQLKETTKTHKPRRIGINNSLLNVLIELKRTAVGEFVCSAESAGCKDSSHAARALAADSKKAGVKVIRFHDLRHTFATQFMSNGGSLFDLSHVLGHQSSTMTQRYAHFDSSRVQGVANVVCFEPSTTSSVIPIRASAVR